MTVDGRLRVGILLAKRPGDLGAWLADAAAFDAAGADALWIDVEAETGLDALTLTAALVATTGKATLIARLAEGTAPEALSTLRRLSRGRFLPMDEAGRWLRVPVPESRAQWRQSLTNVDSETTVDRVVDGVLVEADPRLLDLLRNPTEPGERHDLQLTQG